MAPIDFRILGPLEVLERDHPVALGGRKQRALLALLLLHVSETVTMDRLIDELWGEDSPATATKTVQVYISRLRKALATGEGPAGVVVTRDHGYALELDRERLDAHRFERLVAEGRSELAANGPECAAVALEGALSLWRGRPLADLAYEPFVQGEIARLEELRLEALELLVEAKLVLGRHAEVVGQLEALIAEHPFRERLRAQLMLALYRCDRQADALQAYQDARRTLVEELGIEPGEHVRELERAILVQEPGLAVRVVEQAAIAEDVPEGASWPAAPVSPLLEREGELELLDRLLDDAARGRGRVALIAGPGGIGKTRLLAWARERAHAADVTVLSARGGELERDFGFGITRQLIEPTLAHASTDKRDELFAGAARLAEPVFAPEPAPGGIGGDPTHAVLHGLYWLVANLAERSPLLLAIDDSHWADGPSLRFLIHLARRLEGLSAAIVLASRSGEEAAQPELLQGLMSEADPPILRPGPLNEASVKSLVREVLGTDVRSTLCAACHEATGGNPFLLGELLEELHRDEREPEEIDPSAVAQLGPERIAAAVLSRVARLDSRAPTLARAVAVLGARATLTHAADLARIDPAQARSLAWSLSDAAVFDVGEPLRFRHPIVRSALYEDIPSGERAELHMRAARLLTDDPAEPEAVAIHLLATAPAGDPATSTILAAAAGTALSRGAPETAARYLRRALAEPPPDDQRATLLHILGGAELQSGDPGGLERLRDAFETAPAGRPRAEVARTLGRVLTNSGYFEEAIARIETAIAAVPTDERELRLQLEAEVTTAARLFPTTYARAGERLRALAGEARGETPGERLVLASLSFQRGFEGASAEEAGSLAKRALAAGVTAEHGTMPGAVWDATYALVLGEEFDAAERLCRSALAKARAGASPLGVLLASSFRSFIAYRRGQLARAEGEARTALDSARAVGAEMGMTGVAAGWLIEALIDQAKLEPAGDALAASGFGEEIPDSFMLNYLLHARGRLRLVRGDTDAGIADLRELWERAAAWNGPSPMTLPWLSSDLAVALVRRGELGEARHLAQQELAVARSWGSPCAVGVALRTSGLVEGGDRGLELLTEAAATLEHSEGRLEYARALADLGTALRGAGNQRDARERLSEGMELASRCAATALFERAREELRAAGARPPPRALTGADLLTSSERQIAEMASEGMSNKEIAQALFATMHTVETSLPHAYGKLGIASRRQLRRALRKR